MWSEVVVYFRLGLTHIADFGAYDHIVFLLALCAGFLIRDWKKVLWMVTAFTVGHTVTLALATLNLVSVNATLVEILIAITILVAASSNIFLKRRHTIATSGRRTLADVVRYSLIVVYGLIHGLGFSGYLRNLLGGEDDIVVQLLSFNIGLEIGQLMIVAVLLSVGTAIVQFGGAKQRDWVLASSGGAIALALVMLIERILV